MNQGLQGQLEKIGSNILDKYGTNFLIGAFFPAFIFTGFCTLMFWQFLPARVQLLFGPSPQNLISQSGLVFLIFAFVLGLVLSSLSTTIYKFYEGYIFLWRFSFLVKGEQRRLVRLTRELEKVSRRIAYLNKRKASSSGTVLKKIETRLEHLKGLEHNLRINRAYSFATSSQYILPTRFGNVLRSAESYPGDRYSIDAVPVWFRMVHVIPDRYMGIIDNTYDRCSFLLNLSILSMIFSALCVLAIGIQAVRQPESSLIFSSVYWPYLAAIPLSILVAWLFYQAALYTVSAYGSMIRASYDLFRNDLVKALNLELPEDSIEELDLWSKISEFFNFGRQYGPLYFKYVYPAKDEEKTSTESVTGGRK